MKVYFSKQVIDSNPSLHIFFRVIINPKLNNEDKIYKVIHIVNKARVEKNIPITIFQLDDYNTDLFITHSINGDTIEIKKNAVESISSDKLILKDENGIRALLREKDSYAHKIHISSKNIVILIIVENQKKERSIQTLNTVVKTVSEIVKGKVSDVESCEPEYKELKTDFRQTVISGVRPTGSLHLGNYLGAVKKMVELQNFERFNTLYMVANMSAITTPYDRKLLPNNMRNIVIDYLACGLNPEKSIIFLQSDVNEHVELAYLLSSIYSLAKLQHLPTFKDKIKQHPDNVTLALLTYPILMASGILLYKSNLVPVGIDQEPHLEVAREVARKMNQVFNTSFPEPKRFVNDSEFIPSLNGQGKMSKSILGSYINIDDPYKIIRKKILSMPTSSRLDKDMTPGVKTLFDLLKIFSKQQYDYYLSQCVSKKLRFIDVKESLSKLIYKELKPIQDKKKELLMSPNVVNTILENGASKAKEIANRTIKEVKEKMGLII